jgi:DNA-binding MarR family transcriptional regulator
MAKRRVRTSNDPILQELGEIKRLLILFLIKSGTPQGEISTALNVDQSAVSRMFPARRMKLFKFI